MPPLQNRAGRKPTLTDENVAKMAAEASADGLLNGFKGFREFEGDLENARKMQHAAMYHCDPDAISLPSTSRSTKYRIHSRVCDAVEKNPTTVTSRRIEAYGDILNSVSNAAVGFGGLNISDEHPNGDIDPDYIWCVDATGNGIGKAQDRKGQVRLPSIAKKQLKQQSRSVSRFVSKSAANLKYRCIKSFFCTTASGKLPCSIHVIKV